MTQTEQYCIAMDCLPLQSVVETLSSRALKKRHSTKSVLNGNFKNPPKNVTFFFNFWETL